MRRLRASVIFVLCVATSACGSGTKNTTGTGGGAGGGSGGSVGPNVDGGTHGISCGLFTACGGNIVGTWRVVSSCGSVSSSSCPSSERITVQTTLTQGTYTFAGDGTFTLMASGSATETLRYPLACLGGITDAGIPQACADIERAFVASTQPADAGTPAVEVTSASCASAANAACACTVVLGYTSPQTTSGTYTTSGSQITFAVRAADGGTDPASEYCVSGNTLTLHFFDTTSDWVMVLTR